LACLIIAILYIMVVENTVSYFAGSDFFPGRHFGTNYSWIREFY